MRKAIVDKRIKHQDIGGKEITIEKVMMFGDAPLNYALKNFIERLDKLPDVDDIIYYGHVGYFGYFVLPSEVEEID